MLRKSNPMKSSVMEIFNSSAPIKGSTCGFYLVLYATSSSFYWLNNVSSLFIASSNRTLNKKNVASNFWVNLGRFMFFFKKANNASMGGGTGSFFSVSRLINTGSVVAKYNIYSMGNHNIILNNLISKVATNVSIHVLNNNIITSSFIKFKPSLSSKKFRSIKSDYNINLFSFKSSSASLSRWLVPLVKSSKMNKFFKWSRLKSSLAFFQISKKNTLFFTKLISKLSTSLFISMN